MGLAKKFVLGGVGVKATQMGEVVEIRCLPAAEQGKKATQKGKPGEIRCL